MPWAACPPGTFPRPATPAPPARGRPTGRQIPPPRSRARACSARGDTVPCHVGVDHHLDQLAEIDLGPPPQLRPRLPGIRHEQVDLGWTYEALVLNDVRLPIEPNARERHLTQLANGMG